MRNSKNGRVRRARVALVSGIAALGVSGVVATSAHAVDVPVDVDFESGALDLGPAIKGTDVLPGAAVATAHLQVDSTVLGGAEGPIFMNAAGLDFPVWSTTAVGNNITVDLVLTETQNGTYNGTTGVLTTQPATYNAVITTQTTDTDPNTPGPQPGPVNDCTITTDLAFSTGSNGQPGAMTGQPFAPALAVGTPPGTAVGSIVANWPDLPDAVPGGASNCTLVNGIIHGVGGIWLGKNVEDPTRVPEPPAPPANTTPPAQTKKKCKKGQKLKKGKCVKKKKKKKKKKK